MTADLPFIAVIDSDASFRAELEMLLGGAGLAVALFSSAEEFLTRSWSHSPHCIVLDVRLRGMSGLDLQSRQARADRKTPLVFLTGYDDVRTSVLAMKAGAIDYLVKPIQDEELLDAVNRGIERDCAQRLQKQTLDELRAKLASLSARERETLVLLSSGQGPKEIAGKLGVCTHTARVHIGRTMCKMGARTIVGLARMTDMLGFCQAKRQFLPAAFWGATAVEMSLKAQEPAALAALQR